MQVFIFLLIYLYVANWGRINDFVKGYIFEKSTKKIIDKKLFKFIYKKTDIQLTYFTLYSSDRCFAYCGGLPGKPLLVISTKAYSLFTGSSRDWLLLHEIGHYALNHSIIISLIELFYGILGIALILHTMQLLTFSILFSIVLAIILGSLSIQTNKLLDIQANHFALARIDNPQGMITGAKILIRQAKKRGVYKDTLSMKLFYPWNYGMWNKTISDAKKFLRNNYE